MIFHEALPPSTIRLIQAIFKHLKARSMSVEVNTVYKRLRDCQNRGAVYKIG